MSLADFAEYGVTETDIEFLRQKELEGNLITIRGSRATTGELVAYTPASGKIFYLYKASIVPHIGPAQAYCIADLENDATVVETLSVGINNTAEVSGKFSSTVIGDSLVGDGAKKYRLNVTNINGTHSGNIIGWIEDT